MKIICTTSDKYLHLIPVFAYLFNKYWPGQYCEIVGYDAPGELPDNFTFHSMGTQGAVKEWSTDLRKCFETQPDWFVWIMEDTFFKAPVKMPARFPMMRDVGRICLTDDIEKREHSFIGDKVYANPASRYRLSTQPSIWNRTYLLQYLTDGMDPWTFETQDPVNDGWDIVGFANPPVKHNEGVRRFDPHKLNFDGIEQVDIDHINKLLL